MYRISGCGVVKLFCNGYQTNACIQSRAGFEKLSVQEVDDWVRSSGAADVDASEAINNTM